jgi:hypothetical protein
MVVIPNCGASTHDYFDIDQNISLLRSEKLESLLAIVFVVVHGIHQFVNEGTDSFRYTL